MLTCFLVVQCEQCCAAKRCRVQRAGGVQDSKVKRADPISIRSHQLLLLLLLWLLLSGDKVAGSPSSMKCCTCVAVRTAKSGTSCSRYCLSAKQFRMHRVISAPTRDWVQLIIVHWKMAANMEVNVQRNVSHFQ